ncbi:hypothetical protein QTO34_005484 [Cnephaeus nilssonii]|uniref:Uncharacterized protein n=1 Tax=Cnephaeus nilssonii TaxID=3371016 RepID=A0AA40HNN0_CNENI|nr:hypothetical protein QTO34_005484 [Eptesicus nilssonii]
MRSPPWNLPWVLPQRRNHLLRLLTVSPQKSWCYPPCVDLFLFFSFLFFIFIFIHGHSHLLPELALIAQRSQQIASGGCRPISP